MKTKLRRSFETCPNCGAPTPREFCDSCGQRNLDLHASLGALVSEAIEELIGADSRLGRTLFALFFRPGLLSREYRLGRRAHYTSPIKLYLAASAFFFVLGASNAAAVRVDVNGINIGQQTTSEGNPVSPAPPPEHLVELRKLLSRFGHVGARANAQLDRSFSTDPLVAAEAHRAIDEGFANGLPRTIFLLLPAFALLLKLLYWRGRFLVDHAVFVLHTVSATLLVLTGLSWLTGKAQVVSAVIAGLWCGYVFVALRTMYEQAWWLTVLKGVVFLAVVCLLVAIGFAVLATIDFLTF